MRKQPATVTMFHGTAYAKHGSIMRHGLRRAAHGGPYVTPSREEAIGYGIAATQEHKRATGARDPKVIVYRLQIPEDRLQPATAEGAHKPRGEFCVPNGVPRAWFVDAETGGLPADPAHTEEFSATGRVTWRTLDTLAALGLAVDMPTLIRACALAQALRQP